MLLIDSGNSAIKCRLIQHDTILDQNFETYDDTSLSGFNQFLSSTKPKKVFLASVSAEKLTQKIIENVFKFTGLPVVRLTTLVELGGLKNGYDNYKQLGVDRWLSLLGAYDLLNTDAFIIDAGSAIKIELLSIKKGYLGGAILPGFNTQKQRFRTFFPELNFSHSDIKATDRPGRSTAACIHLNEYPVTVKQIKSLLQKWQVYLDQPAKIIVCGQDADLIAGQLEGAYQQVPDLIFKGMLKQIQLQG